MHVVMFDIDGTLVDSAGFDGELYAAAVGEVTGVQLDQRWGRYEHVSDSGILEQVLREPRFSNDRAALAARVQQHFVGLVRDYLEAQSKSVREIAGAKRLIERLRGLPDVRVAQRALGGATRSRATFGDGPWDQQASRELGYDVVAIGRGVSHPVAFDDFSDSDAILERLHLRA